MTRTRIIGRRRVSLQQHQKKKKRRQKGKRYKEPSDENVRDLPSLGERAKENEVE